MMSENNIEAPDSDGFEHVTQPLENIKEDVEGSVSEGVGEKIASDEENSDDKTEKKEDRTKNLDVKNNSREKNSKAVPTDLSKRTSENCPTWTRMHLRHLSLKVLKTHNIDYIIDKADPDYVLIQRFVPEHEQDFLWAATRALRTRRNPAHHVSNSVSPRRRRFEGASSPGIIEVRRAGSEAELKLDVNRMEVKEWVGVKHMEQRGKHVLDVALEEGIAVRLAINSEALKDELRVVVGAGVGLEISEERRVLLAPWKVLVEYGGAIRQRLQKLEEMIKSRDAVLVEDQVEEGDKEPHQVHEEVRSETYEIRIRPPPIPCEVCDVIYPSHKTPLECLDTRIPHLKCLIEFMDCDLKHVFDLRQRIKDGTLKEIAFADLWHLFNPGDLIVTSPLSRAYRIFHISGGRPRLSKPDLFEKKTVVSPFNINCFYMDQDWKSVGPIHETLRIQDYVGKKSVMELQFELDGKLMVEKVMICPVKMLSVEDRRNQMINLISRGKKLRSLRQGDHKYYSGSAGEEVSNLSGDDDLRFPRRVPVYQARSAVDSRKEPEYVESYVIIDNEVHGDNKAIGLIDAIEFDYRETAESCTHYGVSNNQYIINDRFRRDCRCSDVVVDYVVDNDRAAKYKDDLHLLKPRDINDELGDDHLMLLPPTIEGFVLQKKAWKMLRVDMISDLKELEMTNQVDFKDLVLPAGHEKLLKALVSTHPSSKSWLSQENNKSSSLAIFLHGPKSTGKHLMVKALASHFDKPLYTITGSDCGINTWDFAREFANHFKRATKWNCIVAIPDADSLFPHRKTASDSDFDASGVFLRELELFNGIVVLSTDRKYVVEEQVVNGMNVCLENDSWSKEDNMTVWHRAWRLKSDEALLSSNELHSLEMQQSTRSYWLKFIEREYTMGKRWNGVEIDNYFDTALAMAKYDNDGSQTLVLETNHLIIAARVTGASVSSVF
ncbi:hypothetical protein SBOR_10071 [Sclerotinia borealis F-4128]|uniref:Uncharacterized protein n=1 Tax=Sclerotinia borealis (strain F-4128) TaxID=1432307 RepID=W9C3N1_SCLBF|nr:hypothetical protein SBOR_10071 [Sclerotinia borealis F-4128]